MSAKVSSVPLGESLKSALAISAFMVTTWLLIRLILSLENLPLGVACSALIGAVFGFAGARAENGRPFITLRRSWWWVIAVAFAVIATIYDVDYDMLIGGVMTATILLTTILSFALFHMRMGDRHE